MNYSLYHQAKERLIKGGEFSIEEAFDLAKYCNTLLKNPEQEQYGREIAIRVLDNVSKFPDGTKELWNDIIEMSGLYPYVDSSLLDTSALLRYEYHKSKYLKGVYLHEEQLELSNSLIAGNSIILSAPTSFGKSLLIEEVIASKKYKCIVIIQPTLALLDETRKKLHKYKEVYNLIVSTSQMPSEDLGNIFLFTGERVVEYQHFPEIDFFVIDEFYKLSLNREDDRAVTLNQAFHKLLKRTDKFYLLGPVVKSIPISFQKKLNIGIRATSFATVAIDEIPMIGSEKEKKEEKIFRLFDLLASLQEPTLIYCSSPEKASVLAMQFQDFLAINFGVEDSGLNADIVEWLDENIHDKWSLRETLGTGIGFHNGILPRHLGSSIVDAFNSGSIKYLFCTSTLIEGVNTTAKNIVLFDNTKGNKTPIDFFDYKNIAGRSGRMKVHFTGRIFKFYNTPQQLELEVDIPFVTQTTAPLELLVQLDENELLPESKERLQVYAHVEADLMQVIKSNNGLSIDGQLKIVHEIENNLGRYSRDIAWTGFPKYYQLLPVIELAWNNLLKKTDSKANVASAKQLTTLAIQYSIYKTAKGVIDNQINSPYWLQQIPDDDVRVNKITFNVLNATRHWFDYKLPKFLTTVSKLQEYVFQKHGINPGEYTLFSSMLENGFMSSDITILLEYDIPMSALRKLETMLPKNINSNQVIDRLRQLNLKNAGLNNYEHKKITQIL